MSANDQLSIAGLETLSSHNQVARYDRKANLQCFTLFQHGPPGAHVSIGIGSLRVQTEQHDVLLTE